jgi:RNA polymerase sigma-70 factor, ECF subfamily
MDRSRNLFWKLAEPEHLKVRSYCRKLMGNREDGDDLYHDVLVHALTKFDSLRDINSFRPWLYRIVINNFKNSIRRPWWKRLIPLTNEIEENESRGNPENGYAARRHLERAFRVLSPNDQALITLVELEGWPIKEVAALDRKSEGSLKVRLFRARKKMRKALTACSSGLKKTKAVKTIISEESICVAVKSDAE